MTTYVKNPKRILSLLLALFMMLSIVAASIQPVFAILKTPERPKIIAAAVDGNTVSIKWSKVKNATKYKVYVRTGPDKWTYIKTVRKTNSNKKKYSGKLNYKVKRSGNKYKVYRRTNRFISNAVVKECSYTFEGEYGCSYAFIIKPFSVKKAGIASKIKAVSLPEKRAEPNLEQDSQLEPEPEPQEDLSQPDQVNVDTVRAYAAKLYSENMTADRDYLKGGFTWDQEFARNKSKDPNATTYGWKYFNAMMLEAFLTENPDYVSEILRFYDSHFNESGELLISSGRLYPGGSVDAAMPAALMTELVLMGVTDEAQTANYNHAANTVYNKLEIQYMYDGEDGRPYAGKIWMHHQKKDPDTGEIIPVNAWSKWPVCVDGIYMSQHFLIRLAEAIDSGKMTIVSVDGHIVNSRELWDDVYTRLHYAADAFRIKETGLIAHVCSPERGETNNISWSRGEGWFMMTMLEAIEKMPDVTKKQELQKQFDTLMRSALEWQDSDSHLWYNVMARKDDLTKNQPETSGSAMLSYCLLRGYKDGILKDEEYRKAGLMAFNAIVKYHYDETAGLSDTLISMGPASTEAAYQNPQFVINEAKGIAPLIMAAEYVMP